MSQWPMPNGTPTPSASATEPKSASPMRTITPPERAPHRAGCSLANLGRASLTMTPIRQGRSRLHSRRRAARAVPGEGGMVSSPFTASTPSKPPSSKASITRSKKRAPPRPAWAGIRTAMRPRDGRAGPGDNRERGRGPCCARCPPLRRPRAPKRGVDHAVEQLLFVAAGRARH
jgi:hypothetical protein